MAGCHLMLMRGHSCPRPNTVRGMTSFNIFPIDPVAIVRMALIISGNCLRKTDGATPDNLSLPSIVFRHHHHATKTEKKKKKKKEGEREGGREGGEGKSQRRSANEIFLEHPHHLIPPTLIEKWRQ